jgi:xanthine dehydrogenase accessory factor
MRIIANTACELLASNQPFVLATIISHSGSTPRTSGSKMIVTADGRGVGTIGGGIIEAGAMSKAVELIGQEQSAVIPFDLSEQSVATMDMICGGQAEVLLDYVAPSASNRTVFSAWRELFASGASGSLLTMVKKNGDKISAVHHGIVSARGEILGDLPLSAIEQDQVGAVASSSMIHTLSIIDGFVVVEPVGRICRAFIFGAGHVAQPTAHLAAMVGFAVSVADDRKEFANAERFPDAGEIRVLENFKESFAGLELSPDDYVVILTRGHLHDKTVLAQALKTQAGYIGMIGSRKKRDAIYSALFEEGYTQADIDRVHSPIGISIDAETPEEIGVSIIGEMIQHRVRSKEK